MRIFWFLLIALSACTHAPQREPAAACLANGRPLAMEQVWQNALETMNQYRGIQAYMEVSFTPRVQDELGDGEKNCADEERLKGLGADVEMSLAYFRAKKNHARDFGMRMADPRLIESLACMKPLVDQLRPDFEQVVTGFDESIRTLENLQSLLLDFTRRHPRRCAAKPAWNFKRLLHSLVQTSEPARGSGFFIEAGGQKYLLTAAHVSLVSPAAAEQVLTFTSGESVEQEEMNLAPGEFSAALDVSLKKTSRATPALKAASASELRALEAGRPFYALGFPLNKKGRAVAIPCRFEGFAPGQRQSHEAQMLLYCPGRTRAVGLSGGPLVDDQGRVWGMNSSEAAYSGALLVTPVLEDQGHLQLGVQQTFLSSHCYERNLAAPRRCQVMPNMFETQIP